MLALRIQEKFDELTRSEQKLAAVLLDHSDDILSFSAKELSLASGVSAATAVRLFRSLGYRDFNEVRLQARQERNFVGPATGRGVSLESVPQGQVTVASHLQVELANLTRTFTALQAATLRQAAESLSGARRVWIAGLGADSAVANLAWTLFSQARPGVQLLPNDAQSWPAELASMGPGDLMLAIAPRPWLNAFNPVLEFCRTARVRLVAICDPTSQGRIERHAGIALVCHMNQVPHTRAYTSMISMVALLHVAVLERLGDSALMRAQLIEGLREEFLSD
ncbi:MAG TPA: MurR/RpiR family transcriptional regulator [Steroidobacteraceae bacterium]|nr:MurR/RpiR family transcriptional regulator [Steroidobacteraceae bacterium]